ncbi:MAG: hypothetical protein DIU71_00400 [Proteobacteria bacterium]|nr:MAG: hypothetical protein DIU71_00400 [Pseudomonadota bacterium]
MNIIRSAILATCASVAVSGLALAQAPESGERHLRHTHMGMMHKHGRAHALRSDSFLGVIRQLELSDEQRQGIRSLLEANGGQRKALRERRQRNAAAMATALPNDPDYPALIEEQKRLAADLIQHRSELRTQVFALLTPEQQARLPELLAERQARIEERRKKMRERFRERRAAADA